MGGSGPIVITGRSSEYHISSLEIEAFDRTYSISDKVISDLGGVYVNGLAISYEAGYKVTGGRSLYFTFVKSSLQKETTRVALILKENGEYRVK